ncbi:hypothetical protein L218DRAFT_1004969 [Marasmius fiardii PR-910]|nr:hypothetical protein L218DRAFT_1004969 [Marasmius fiardii PR-910]
MFSGEYFKPHVGVTVVSLINVIVTILLPTDLIFIISDLERVLHTLFASHAILHIREVATTGRRQTSYMLSDMNFQSGSDSEATNRSEGGVKTMPSIDPASQSKGDAPTEERRK